MVHLSLNDHKDYYEIINCIFYKFDYNPECLCILYGQLDTNARANDAASDTRAATIQMRVRVLKAMI